MAASEPDSDLRSRDRIIFLLLGQFFVAFGVLVWVGLLWPQSGQERLVSGVSGGILIAIGILGVVLARRLRR